MSLTNAEIKNLKDKKFRKQNNLFLVEGDKFCKDLQGCGVEILSTITDDKNLTGFPNISVVSRKQLELLASTKTCQSIICVCKRKDFGFSSVGNSLILDNLQDPGNVGTLIRSALAFGFKDVYMIEGADPFSEKVIRSSAGTILKCRLHFVAHEQINLLKQIADEFLVADMDGVSISGLKAPKGKIAIIVGNEGQGVSKEMCAFATRKVAIPMANGVESLNAGVAGSIIMQKLSEVE